MAPERIRVLHVLGSLEAGGIETWLTHVHRHVDRARFQFDYLVHTASRSHRAEMVTALGGRIHVCSSPHNPLKYVPALIRTLRRAGPFDVVHAHVHHFSGLVLLAARTAGVPIRIAHCHTSGLPHKPYLSLPRHLYCALMARWIRRHATHRLSGSHAAAPALFGPDAASAGAYVVHPYGIDLEPFRTVGGGACVREEFGIPQSALVVGHVGSFTPVKNHELLVRMFARLRERRSDAKLLLVGDGPLKASTRRLARTLGCDADMVFAGERRDVPRVMRAMDVFVFPSLSEGLGLVGLEAQAAGVAVVASAGVPREAAAVPGLMSWVDDSAPSAWVAAVLDAVSRPRVVTPEGACVHMERSRFNIACSVRGLEQIYASGYAAAHAARSADAAVAR